jgi:hypothetical protein
MVPEPSYSHNGLVEVFLRSRALLGLCASLVALVFGWLAWRNISPARRLGERSAPIIVKQPVAYANHTFEPTAPPANMPPLTGGEIAACDSDFESNASVRGESRQTDATHATVTITQVKMTLQLNINVWVPTGASQRVLEHEEGHRQISEYYYKTADKLAEKIAAEYLGRRIDITGPDLGIEFSKALQQTAREIGDQYSKELNPGPTQLLYDSITDHGRNDTVVQDAVAHAIKNVVVDSAPATANPGN